MQINKEYLYTTFMQAKPDTRMDELGLYLEIISTHMYKKWYVVVSLNANAWSVFNVAELIEALRKTENASQSSLLKHFPELLIPCHSVERLSIGIGQARQEMRRSHKQRLLVVEDGEPVGILHSELLGGILDRFPLDLFHRVNLLNQQESSILYRCPLCNRTYSFRELVNLEDKRLICPVGHIVAEDS